MLEIGRKGSRIDKWCQLKAPCYHLAAMLLYSIRSHVTSFLVSQTRWLVNKSKSFRPKLKKTLSFTLFQNQQVSLLAKICLRASKPASRTRVLKKKFKWTMASRTKAMPFQSTSQARCSAPRWDSSLTKLTCSIHRVQMLSCKKKGALMLVMQMKTRSWLVTFQE